MCVYLYICIYVCVYIYMYIYYTYVYTYMYIYLYVLNIVSCPLPKPKKGLFLVLKQLFDRT